MAVDWTKVLLEDLGLIALQVIASKAGVTLPGEKIVGKVGSTIESGIRKAGVPEAANPLALSREGTIARKVENSSSVLNKIEAAGIEPVDTALVLNNAKYGYMTPEEATNRLKIGTADWQTLSDATRNIEELPTTSYIAIKEAIRSSALAANPPILETGPAGEALGKLNTAAKRMFLGNPLVTPVINEMGLMAQAGLEGISPVKILQLTKYPNNISPKLGRYLNGAPVPEELGIKEGTAQNFLDFANPQESVITPQGLISSVATGAGVGGASAGPAGAGVGGLTAGLAYGGTKLTSAAMQPREKVYRTAFYETGLENTLPKAFQSRAPELQQEFGNAYPAFENFLKQNEYFVNPDIVAEFGLQQGIPANNISRIQNIVLNINANASAEVAVPFSNFRAYTYSQTPNVVEWTKKVAPFAVWPMNNLVYSAAMALKYPALAGAVINTLAAAKQNQEEENLPYRFNQKVPVGDTGVYVNPLAPLAIAQQIQEPYPNAPGTNPSIIDKAIDTLGAVGLGTTPLIGLPLQAMGITGQKQDPQTLNPWNRLAIPAYEWITGETIDPEGAIKTAVNAIRSEVAPETASEVPYLDYQVRKKLAEMSIASTGKPWWENEDYKAAMVDTSNSLWKEATQATGKEQTLLWAARRAVPLPMAYLPPEEATIRSADAQNPEDMSTEAYVSSLDTNPLASGYRWLSTPTPELQLKIKQDTYYNLPKGESRSLFLQQNPDLAGYLTWYGNLKKQGLTPTIENYVKQFNQ